MTTRAWLARHVLAAGLVAACTLPLAVEAQGRRSTLAIHIECNGQTPADDRVTLPQWYSGVLPDRERSVCVLRKPIVAGPPIRSLRVDDAPDGRGVDVAIELTDATFEALRPATTEYVGRGLVIVIGGRVAAKPILRATLDSPRFPLRAPTFEQSYELIRALPWQAPVLTTSRSRSSSSDIKATPNPAAAPPLCAAMERAATEVLGTTLFRKERAGLQCALEGSGMQVAASLTPGAGVASLEAQRLALEKPGTNILQSEASLGTGAFSAIGSGKRTFVFATSGGIVVLTVELGARSDAAREYATFVKKQLP